MCAVMFIALFPFDFYISYVQVETSCLTTIKPLLLKCISHGSKEKFQPDIGTGLKGKKSPKSL